jgi:CII-binding regulator of phage lambda lysogenization HflD
MSESEQQTPWERYESALEELQNFAIIDDTNGVLQPHIAALSQLLKDSRTLDDNLNSYVLAILHFKRFLEDNYADTKQLSSVLQCLERYLNHYGIEL